MDLATFPRFESKERKVQRKEKERKKKEKKNEERKTFVFETVCWWNIASLCKYLFGPRLLKSWLYFKWPLVEIYLLYYLPSELPSFAYICFSFIRFNLFSLNVLFALKTLHGKLELPTTVNSILSQPRGPCLPLS